MTGRGKHVVTFDMKTDPPDDDTLAAAILGPTGNLKAPTLRIGDTLLVGFNEEAYKTAFLGQMTPASTEPVRAYPPLSLRPYLPASL